LKYINNSRKLTLLGQYLHLYEVFILKIDVIFNKAYI
jgi:hypothetical protein